MCVIPPFTPDGLLPAGDYEVTFPELRRSILAQGPQGAPNWDRDWRLGLIDNLETLTRQFWSVGVRDVFADGSFAEDKDHPNDIDGYFTCDLNELASGELTRRLNAIDPYNAWTWDPGSRRPYRGYPKAQLPMWHAYRVALYPHIPGFGCGICDSYGNELEFPAAFRQSRRDGAPRGIIRLKDGD